MLTGSRSAEGMLSSWVDPNLQLKMDELWSRKKVCYYYIELML